jgi:tartrate-resistant acid phosphatase type 5
MCDYVQNPENQIEFIINLGDSFYPAGVESVTDPQWYSRFESIFDPDILNMPFYSILGNHDYQGNINAQLDSWLEESDADWKIVCGHKPLFSNGDHGSSGPLIARLQEILDHRADLYICGHEHDMEILDKVNGVYYIVNGAAARSRDTSVGDNTILAASRIGFMTLLMSESVLVCKVIESGSGIINTTVLKEK